MKYLSNSVIKTKDIGGKLGKNLNPGDVIGLFGKLATGKTVFAKALLEGLGMEDTRYVKSPSFILMREYQVRNLKVYHFDLYRLNNINRIQEIGWDELISSNGICIIEWAQRAKKIMPREYLKIEFYIEGKNSRKLCFYPKGKRYRQLVKEVSLS